MKKLVSICLIICMIGGVLAIGGVAAGGMLYGSFYGGRLHSVRDAISDAAYELRRDWNDWDWDWDDDNQYDSIPHAEAVNPEKPEASLFPTAAVSKLELDLGRGKFRLEESDNFAVSGGKIEQSEQDSDEWKLKVRSALGHETEEIVIGIPAAYYEKIEIALGASSLDIDVSLAADEIDLAVGAAALYVSQPLDTRDLELAVGAGSVQALLAGAQDEYGWEAAASGGTVSLNDTVLLSGLFGSANDRRRSAPRQLDIALGAGSIELTTAE